jgi:hypothetical protein
MKKIKMVKWGWAPTFLGISSMILAMTLDSFQCDPVTWIKSILAIQKGILVTVCDYSPYVIGIVLLLGGLYRMQIEPEENSS